MVHVGRNFCRYSWINSEGTRVRSTREYYKEDMSHDFLFRVSGVAFFISGNLDEARTSSNGSPRCARPR